MRVPHPSYFRHFGFLPGSAARIARQPTRTWFCIRVPEATELSGQIVAFESKADRDRCRGPGDVCFSFRLRP